MHTRSTFCTLRSTFPCAAVNLDDQALQRLARRRRVALAGELGQPGCGSASLSARLRRDAVLDGDHAVRASGVPAEELREPGHAGDPRVVLRPDDQAGSEPVGQRDAGPRPNQAPPARTTIGYRLSAIGDDLGERACAPGKTPSGHGAPCPNQAPPARATIGYRLSAIGYGPCHPAAGFSPTAESSSHALSLLPPGRGRRCAAPLHR